MFDFGMFSPGSVAVVTGAASGIGLAAAHRFAAMGFKVALVDLPGDSLDRACRQLAEGGRPVMALGVMSATLPRCRPWRRPFRRHGAMCP